MKADIIKVIQLVLKTIGNLSDRDLQRLLNGEGKLIYTEVEQAKKVVETQADKPTQSISQQLRSLSSREEAANILSQKSILKKDLLEIASTFKVHINKSDTKAKLIEKIIEATVGVKLRSQAIRETSVKR